MRRVPAQKPKSEAPGTETRLKRKRTKLFERHQGPRDQITMGEKESTIDEDDDEIEEGEVLEERKVNQREGGDDDDDAAERKTKNKKKEKDQLCKKYGRRRSKNVQSSPHKLPDTQKPKKTDELGKSTKNLHAAVYPLIGLVDSKLLHNQMQRENIILLQVLLSFREKGLLDLEK